MDEAIDKDSANIYAQINRAVDKMLKDYKSSIEDYTQIIELDSGNALTFL